MNTKQKTSAPNEEAINYDDIPEITDFSKGYKKPEISARMKNGYTIVIEHKDYDEVIKIKRNIRKRRPTRKVTV